MSKRVFFCFCLAMGLLTLQARAQQNAAASAANAHQPIEITAQKTLEWHRNDNQYIARGDVVATQGDTSIRSETLTADYREDDKSKNDIYKLTAVDHVRIEAHGSTAEGDLAVYNVDKGLATLTGKHLQLISPQQTVTARDRFEYWTEAGQLNAIGAAHAIKGEDTMDSDIMSAFFVDDPQTKQRQLSKLTAQGHVVITTPSEVLRGDRGIYEAKTGIAQLFDHVTVQRGPNILQGDSADIDLNTNISRMHGGETAPGGRVRAVFYPGSGKDGDTHGNDSKAAFPGITMPSASAAPKAAIPVSPPPAAVMPAAGSVSVAPGEEGGRLTAP